MHSLSRMAGIILVAVCVLTVTRDPLTLSAEVAYRCEDDQAPQTSIPETHATVTRDGAINKSQGKLLMEEVARLTSKVDILTKFAPPATENEVPAIFKEVEYER